MAIYRRRKYTTVATPNMRKKIYDSLSGHCAYCGCELDFENFHIDHMIPKSKGGPNGANRVPACPLCNMCKGELSVDEFREKIASLITENDSGQIGLVKKYYDIKPKRSLFYFEEELWRSTGK